MSIQRKVTVFLEKGIAWIKKSGTRDGRKGYNTLNEALDDMARKNCCGINCCDGAIYLPATNGAPVKVQIEIGEGGIPSWVFSTPDED